MVLVSGASGFIGGRLLRLLSSEGINCRALCRKPIEHDRVFVADLSDKANLALACSGISCVFHCAGHAHAFTSLSGRNDALHWRVNFEGTRNLLEAAAEQGVKQFVNLSSVKAMAESGAKCVDEESAGEPETAYGQSKRAAEELVLCAGKQYDMHVVNLRLAMVYGAGGHGNVERMARLVKCGLFPPLPETGNHRSLVHVNDVVVAMRLVAEEGRANGQTYIVASPEAPSGRGLYDALCLASGVSRCEWAVPVSLLNAAAICGDALGFLTRRRMPIDSEALDRLLSSAWYSPARIERELGWRAKVSLSEGLAESVGNEAAI